MHVRPETRLPEVSGHRGLSGGVNGSGCPGPQHRASGAQVQGVDALKGGDEVV
jgi:hypothetical protein